MAFSPWGSLSLPGELSRALQILRFWKYQSCRIWWKCILSTSQLKEYFWRKYSKLIHNPTLCAGSLKVSEVSYVGLHILSVFFSTCAFMLSMFNYYRILRSLVPSKRPKFSKIHEREQDNGDFYFSKFFKIFLPKEQLEGCFIITASYFNRKIIKLTVSSMI